MLLNPHESQNLVYERHSLAASSATNELPLSAIKFSSYPRLCSYDQYDLISDRDAYDTLLHNTPFSPLATNEKPLSLTPLPLLPSDEIISQPSGLGNKGNKIPSLVNRSVSCDDVLTASNSVLASHQSRSPPMYITSPFEFSSYNFYQHERNLGRIYSCSCDTSLHQCTSEYMPSPTRRNSASYASFYSFPGLIGGNNSPPIVGNSSSADLLLFDDQKRASSYDEITIAFTLDSSSYNENSNNDNKNDTKSSLPKICVTSETIFSSFDQQGDDILTTSIKTHPESSTSVALITNINNNYNQNPVVTPDKVVTNDNITTNTIITTSDVTNITDTTHTTTTTTKCSKIITNVCPNTKPHPKIVNPIKSDSPQTGTRRQRHSIAGQMSVFKSLGFRKMAASTNSLFSTAVISGSSSAPNLRDMIPNTATPSGKVLRKFINSHQFFFYFIFRYILPLQLYLYGS